MFGIGTTGGAGSVIVGAAGLIIVGAAAATGSGGDGIGQM